MVYKKKTVFTLIIRNLPKFAIFKTFRNELIPIISLKHKKLFYNNYAMNHNYSFREKMFLSFVHLDIILDNIHNKQRKVYMCYFRCTFRFSQTRLINA